MTGRHTEVIIVGAGPSGLMMAAQLLRYGIQPVIIDSKKGITTHSKALGVQARTLEIYRQMGLVDEALKMGLAAENAIFHKDDFVQELNFVQAGFGQTAYPMILMLEQSKNEQILLDYLSRNACPVYWNTELKEFTQDDKQVKVELNCEGVAEKWTCNWLIGADGASSKVRKSLNIQFEGGTYQNQFYLADVVLNHDWNHNSVQLFLHKNDFLAIFPITGEGHCRAIGVLPTNLRERRDVTFADIEQRFLQLVANDIEVSECNWFSTYKIHHRMASQFRQQNCFLIGDAAHIHSPVGGQGMNTGLQDAYNLAWKLAGVIEAVYTPEILNSYSAERKPIAKALLNTTDRAFTFLVTKNLIVKKFKDWFLPLFVHKIWGNLNFAAKIFNVISQTAIAYRDSKLSVHHSRSKKIKAGDRLPYLKVFDERKDIETDLHDWCGKPGFTLIVFGNFAERSVFTLARWIKLNHPRMLNFYYLPWSAKNQAIFNAFEVGKNEKRVIIVRPDMHIGYMNDVVDIDMIDLYLREIVGFKP